ncbi:hypothetical protein BDV25DRAFT_136158 [Aspergillus avenaceus]|uniref:Rhodopsin domain-containing protein n=1 Tax=Aspergillus avenaceus TaxID=36643 RepID=A0A5N6U6F7_ASPAV|nr:hypothetical protein BDV25DRAFT_136158 [Aspergillus avenaceus]
MSSSSDTSALLGGAESATPQYAGMSIVPPSPKGVTIIAVDVLLIVLTTAFTTLRFYSRQLRKGTLFPEDYLYLVALVFFHGLCWVSIAINVKGFAHHIWDLDPQQTTTVLKVGVTLYTDFMPKLTTRRNHQMTFASSVLYAVSLGLVKISICWSVARIFSTPRTVLGAYVLMAITALWVVANITISFVVCRPVGMNWGDLTPDGHCGNLMVSYTILSIFDLVVDLFILILPIPTLWSLGMPTATRVGLILVFSFGVLTMVFGAIRPAALLRVQEPDVLYTGAMGHLWTVVENGVALIVCSSALLRPVFDRATSTLPSLTKKPSTKSTAQPDENTLVGDIWIGIHVRERRYDYTMELEQGRSATQKYWSGLTAV